MSLTFEQSQALYQLYPSVVYVIDEEAFDAEKNPVAYDKSAVDVQVKLDVCKQQAKQLLAATDWSVLPDVGLANQDDFVFYRLNLRNLVKNPVANPVFGTEPTPVWS